MKQQVTWISEKEAAAMLGYAPYVLRQKVTATSYYKGKEPMPVTFSTAGKGYRYSKEDVEKLLRQGASK